ncbi:MAG: thermonuclease family protein, partial [Candidatus Roizmanbacteria bacterium]
DTIVLEDGSKVRYIGVNTPELHRNNKPLPDCYGQEAYVENKRLVEGKSVKLIKDISEVDKYKRLLRYVYVDSIFVNDYLVKQGFAYASTFPPDVANQSLFRSSQKSAEAQNLGLWNGCPQK